MSIIVKFLVRNIKEKKLRTILILFSITLSTGLFFSSMAISDTVEEMYASQMRKYFGTAEIMIYPNEESPSAFASAHEALSYTNELEYVVGTINGRGLYKPSTIDKIPVELNGYKLADLEIMNPIIYEEKGDIVSFEGKKIIIGGNIADKYDLKLGGTFDIEINERKHRFIIAAIASPQGLFRQDGDNITAVVPKDTLELLYGTKGRDNIIYLKTREPSQIENIISLLSNDYKGYVVKETLTESDMAQFTRSITTTFMLMLVLVVFISIFIIYTSFKVITMERLPLIGTFRSIGATKKMTDILLMGESLVYGIVGGLFGCGIGFIILYVMMLVMSQNGFYESQLEVEMIYSTWQLVAGFIGAVVLSVISSIIPIIQAAKIPVRDIVLNNISTKRKKLRVNKITLIIILISLVLTLLTITMKGSLLVNALNILLIGVGIVILVPFFTRVFIFLFEKIYSYIFGNEGVLAAKNLRDNKSTINNIALLTIGIASLLMINTISYSVSTELINVYNDAKFDIMSNHPRGDRRVEQGIRAIEGVYDTYGVYEGRNIKIIEKNSEIWSVYGIDANKYWDYWDFEFLGNKKEILVKFNEGRNILLSTFLRDKLQVDIGDVITLDTKRGKVPYKVVGFINTIMRTGNVAFVPERYLKRDMELQYMTDIYTKTLKASEYVNEVIKKKYRNDNVWTLTMTELQDIEAKNNEQIFILLKGFSVITMIIGVFGIFNNYIVSFISRKRHLAIYRSIGMSRKQTLKMLLVEALTGGLIGGIIGCLGGLLFITASAQIMYSVNLPIPIHYSPKMFIDALIGGMLISIIASLSPAIKNSRANLIEAIKYE